MASPKDVEEELDGEDTKKNEKEPLGRRGACSFFHNGKFYLYSGYTGGPALSQSSKSELDVLDLSLGRWTEELTKGDGPPRCISGECCTLTNGCLYVFGGWLAGFRNAIVHELNLDSLTWKMLAAKNELEGPMYKDKAGMVAYGNHMLCVFGGYGELVSSWYDSTKQSGASYHPDEASGGVMHWTNELHLFNVPTCEWISPETTGVRPPPCAAFSFTKVDLTRVVLFGGRQQKERVNELHILDMGTWHWSGVILPSRPQELWPSKRSFHAACALVDPDLVCSRNCPNVTCGGCQPTSPASRFPWLPHPVPDLTHADTSKRCFADPKVLVMLGMDNKADPVVDAWILNVNKHTWEEVPLARRMPGRIWHTMSSHFPSPASAEIVIFGGTSQNLFSTYEQLLTNISATTILHHGVSSLYEITTSFILSDWQFFKPLLSHLPLHREKALRDEEQRRTELHNNGCVVLKL